MKNCKLLLLTNAKPKNYTFIICLIVFLCFASITYASYLGFLVEYNDIEWSPNSRMIAYTYSFGLSLEDATSNYPYEAIAYLNINDSIPIILTPPIDRVFLNSKSQLVSWSDLEGWFVLDLNSSKILKHIPKQLDDDMRCNTIENFKQSPNRTLICGIGYDELDNRNILVCWNLDDIESNPLPILILYDVTDFHWQDDNTVICRINDGHEYLKINFKTKEQTIIKKEEKEEFDETYCRFNQVQVINEEMSNLFSLVLTFPKRETLQIQTPVRGILKNPLISPDDKHIVFELWRDNEEPTIYSYNLLDKHLIKLTNGWSPLWLRNDSILYHHNQGLGIISVDGSSQRIIYYPRSAHHPKWLSDSIIEFRVGRPDSQPKPYYIEPSVYNDEFFSGDNETTRYFYDELWQVNINSGLIYPTSKEKCEPISRSIYYNFDSGPIFSPDSSYVIWGGERGSFYIGKSYKEEDGNLILERFR